jgi:hypothetical protein
MKKNILIVSHGAALGGSPISALNIGRFIDKKEFFHFEKADTSIQMI